VPDVFKTFNLTKLRINNKKKPFLLRKAFYRTCHPRNCENQGQWNFRERTELNVSVSLSLCN